MIPVKEIIVALGGWHPDKYILDNFFFFLENILDNISPSNKTAAGSRIAKQFQFYLNLERYK